MLLEGALSALFFCILFVLKYYYEEAYNCFSVLFGWCSHRAATAKQAAVGS